MPGGAVFAALTLALIGGGCAAHARHDLPATNAASIRPCIAVDSMTGSDVAAGQLSGEYRLTMVATSGRRSGRSVSGSFALDDHTGYASIALDSVGAIAPGDIGSRDPNAPGVLLLTSTDSSVTNPTLRFGADANRSDRRMFDGSYSILLVDVATASGFSGRWRSAVNASQSSGYFCADRVASNPSE